MQSNSKYYKRFEWKLNFCFVLQFLMRAPGGTSLHRIMEQLKGVCRLTRFLQKQNCKAIHL